MCVFFFQAEDGIRDGRVTGVQTCALPIFPEQRTIYLDGDVLATRPFPELFQADMGTAAQIGRASCREKCRCRWSAYDEKKNKSWYWRSMIASGRVRCVTSDKVIVVYGKET